MKLDPKIVEELTLPYKFRSYVRVIPKKYAATPLGVGVGSSRFSSPSGIFKLAYVAFNLETAIAEAIVRDRFEGKASRVLDISEIQESSVTEVSAKTDLNVLDVRKNGLLKLGVSTDAARGKAHAEGQQLSEILHEKFDLDGILYLSRLTGEDCVAVYERAVKSKLLPKPAIDLESAADLIDALKSMNVSIRIDP